MGGLSGTVAVTGATGFLGVHLVPALVRHGFSVRMLRRPGSTHPLLRQPPEGAVFRDVDFLSIDALAEACAGAVAVVHGAGLVSYHLKDQPHMRESNVGVTRRMLEAARRAGTRRFAQVSSIVTIGHGRELRDERSEYNAAGLGLAYWDTKTEAERLALEADAPGFEVVSINLGSLLGAGERNAQLKPFLKKLARVRAPLLPDGGSDFVDVRDAAEGSVLALEKGARGQRYIIGSENLTYVELHRRLRAVTRASPSAARALPRWLLGGVASGLGALESLTGIDLPVNAARLRRVNGVYMFHALTKARSELGYRPGPIDDALRVMLEE